MDNTEYIVNEIINFNFSEYIPITANEVNESYYGNYNAYEDNEYENIAGEIAMWRAVLLQAFVDLKSQSKKKRYKPIKYEAYQWFMSYRNKQNVITICQLAHYNYNSVMHCAKNIIAHDAFFAKKMKKISK